MPKNNFLKPVELPMELMFDKAPNTEFKNNLDSILVELIEAPSTEDLLNYIPQFVEATWSPEYDSNDNLPEKEKLRILHDEFFGKTLPTALESINLVFRISGISIQEVTHILRYRTASFSADCSGDKWWSQKDALVPNSIENSNGDPNDYAYSEDFYRRYREIVALSKQLYCDMIDSRKVSIMDARYILPRCLSTFYYMRMSLKDAIHFMRQRVDKQIQPETDNIIAYKMYLAILDKYPMAHGLVDIHAPSQFYVSMARTGKATNLYFPDADSDKFEWNENDFIYQCTRDQMNGTDEGAVNYFNCMLEQIEEQIAEYECPEVQ